MEIKPFIFAIVLAPSIVLAGERELAKLEILSEPGILAQASDEKGDVLVGFTSQQKTFRWVRGAGTQILADGFGPRTTVSRDGSLIAGTIPDAVEPLRRRNAAVWSERDGWQVIAPAHIYGSQANRISRTGRFVTGSVNGEFL